MRYELTMIAKIFGLVFQSRARRSLTVVVLIGIAAFGVLSQQRRMQQSPIDENTLRAHIKFLSDDRLEGRGTGARGGELAALYFASQFEAIGLKGAGKNGSFW